MKIRVSHLLKAIAVLLFIGGLVALFIAQPIRSSSREQAELYNSTLYQTLAQSGKANKAWVIRTTKGKADAINLFIKFFDSHGVTVDGYIALTKVQHQEGDIINIVYNPSSPKEVRLAPNEESALNWPLFGWCMAMGIIFYILGYIRYKVSGGIE